MNKLRTKNILFTWFILSAGIMLAGCFRKEPSPVNIQLEHAISCDSAANNLNSIGFSVFPSIEGLNSNIATTDVFESVGNKLDSISFDFKHNDYLFSFGKRIKKAFNTHERVSCDKKTFRLEVEYQENFSDSIFIYSIPKKPQLSAECG